MEENPYSALKKTFSSVPAKALNISSRLILSNNLDVKQTFTSAKGFARDYRGFGQLVGLQYFAIKKLEESQDRTMDIFEQWETRTDATVGKLIGFLEDMDRHDVIQELVPRLENDREEYLKYQESLKSPIQVNKVTSDFQNLCSETLTLDDFREEGTSDFNSLSLEALTVEDSMTGKHTIYDACLSFAPKDTAIAKKFAETLESKGVRLFISARDILPGKCEFKAEMEMILNRCRRMIILLTPNFMTSSALDFQVYIASHHAIEHRQRIIIPVIMAPCHIPPVLNNLSKIDFTNEETREWILPKLFASLRAEDKMLGPLPNLGRSPLNNRNMIRNSASSSSSEPVISFPPTTQHIFVNNSDSGLGIDELDISEDDASK